MSAPTKTIPGMAAPGRSIFTPFGLYSRYMLGAYLRHTMMVAAALMTIALTIDLWPQVPLFGGNPLACDVEHRAAGGPAAVRPSAAFHSLCRPSWAWCGAKAHFTESRERLLIWNSGRSPLVLPDACAVRRVADGQPCCLRWMPGLRPAAIHVQMAEVLGREGIRLDRSKSGGTHWIALPDGLLKAEIQYGPPLSCTMPPSTSWTAMGISRKWTRLRSRALRATALAPGTRPLLARRFRQ